MREVYPTKLGTLFSILLKIVATEGNISWHFLNIIVRKINTEHLVEVVVVVRVLLKLGDEAWDAVL